MTTTNSSLHDAPQISAKPAPGEKERCVLAYSGGLDTSVCIKWLQEEYDLDVIAVVGDLGQEHEGLEAIKAKALATGAIGCAVIDMRETFANEYLACAMAANAMYENKYPLVSALSRPLIAKHLVAVAHQFGAKYVAHGCTGKGNDQVRFEFAAKALAPDLKVIAPWREWDLMSRTALNAFAEKHGIPISKEAKRYSMDANMMHTSFEGSELEDPGNAPHESCHERCVPVEQAPNEPEIIEVSFERGNPVAVNGEKMSPYTIIKTLAELAGKHGIGRDDMVENRYVGMKCRGVYENPAGTLLYALHRDLEGLCMDRELLQLRDMLAVPYSHAVYNGYWFSPEREAMQAFMDKSQETVTGTVRAKLYKGGVWPLARTSPFSLFSEDLATFEGGNYDHKDAAGFIRLNCLRLGMYAAVRNKLGK